MEMQLPKDFIDFLRSLNEHSVRYLLVGGWAVGLHGYVRATNDLDVWAEATTTNAELLQAALGDFGFKASNLNEAFVLKPKGMLRMGNPPLRIEVLSTISGLTFHEAYEEKVILSIGGMDVPVIGLTDLIRNKRASGRLKDLADAQLLEQLHQ